MLETILALCRAVDNYVLQWAAHSVIMLPGNKEADTMINKPARLKNIKPKYVDSPSWRNGGRDVAGWLVIYAVVFVLAASALLLTGGDR